MGRPPKYGVSAEELAQLAGVSRSQLKLHETAGAPMPKSAEDVPGWLPQYHAWRAAQRRPPGPAPAAAFVDHEFLQHRRELTKYRALSAQIAIAKEQGQLVPLQDVIDYSKQAIDAANNAWDGMIRRLAARLGPLCQGGSAHVEMVATEEAEAIRATFAAGMTRIHERNG